MNTLQAAIDYADNGYVVVPAAPGSKRPDVAWKDLVHKDSDAVALWWDENPLRNVGIRTDGLIVLDVDNIDWLTPDRSETLAGAPIAQTPRGGRHFYFRAPDGLDIRNSADQIGRGIDIRANGGFVVLPPSQTEVGRYQWLDGDLAETSLANLPEPPEWLLTMLADASSQRALADKIASGEKFQEGGRNNMLTSFMGYMRRCGASEAVLFAAGMAKNEEACVPMLDEQEVRAIAKSVARYQPDMLASAEVSGSVCVYDIECEDSHPIIPPDPGEMPKHLTTPRGLMGDVVRYILETSPVPQPTLALGAAVALMSICVAHKVRTKTNLRPNVYIINVAPPASGKDRPLKAVRQILGSTGYGASRFVSNISHSAGGLVSCLEEHNPLLSATDELGKALSGVSGGDWMGNSLSSILLEVYSSSDSERLDGRLYKDKKQNSVVSWPYFSLLGATTPSSMFGGDAIQRDSFSDGLMGRLLCFWAPEKDAPLEDLDLNKPVPASLLDLVNEWCSVNNEWSENHGEDYPSREWHGSGSGLPRIVTVYKTSEAEAATLAFKQICNQRRRDQNDPTAAVWGRCAAHVDKLALLSACSGFDLDPNVTLEIEQHDYEWAVELVTWIVSKTRRELFYSMAESKVEKYGKMLMKQIADANQPLSTTAIFGSGGSLRSLSTTERDLVIRTLQQAGQLHVHPKSTGGRPSIMHWLPSMPLPDFVKEGA